MSKLSTNILHSENFGQASSISNLLQVCSDIHLDYGDITSSEFSKIVEPHAEILVLAGDIGNPFTEIYEQFIQYCAERFKCVLYVAGNHEYYKHKNSISQTNHKIYNILRKYSNVHFLNNKVFEYEGIAFVGTTLWSHIGDEMGPAKLYYMNDFRSISGFSTVVSNYLFKSNVSFITSALEKHENCIIITHHAPSMKCISDKYLGDKLNCCFASDLEHLFKHTHMMGWIYGHTHHNYKEIGERVFLYGNCYRATNYINGPFI
jgi:predicted phosphodiesterase